MIRGLDGEELRWELVLAPSVDQFLEEVAAVFGASFLVVLGSY